MTDHATQERRPEPYSKGGLFVTDAELIRRSGLPEKYGRRLIAYFDNPKNKVNFPKKLPLYGDRRYWPDCEKFFERTAGHRIGPSNGGPNGRSS
jgi:hypothetical protein